MRYSVQIKVFRGDKNNLIQNYVSSFEINEDVTTSEFKTNLKKNINLINGFEVVKESILLGDSELLNDQKVPNKTGLKYEITLKK